MREASIILSETIKEIELEADRAFDRTIHLRNQAKEAALRIKDLEEKVSKIIHFLSL